MRELSRAEFVLTDQQGGLLASSFPQAVRDLPESDSIAAASNQVRLGPAIIVDSQAFYHAAVVLPARSLGESERRLHVLFPVEAYRQSWREAFVPPLIVGAATIVAVGAVARLIGNRLSSSTARLENDVLRIARGDFTPAELPQTNDELQDLSRAINRTAEMLADYEQQVRQTEQMRTVSLLGAGLAHEMRNAATGCRMALDLHAEQCPAPQSDESLFVAKRQLRLMESQLQRFLRAGKPLDDSERREVSLSTLVDDSLSLVRPSARHARVNLAWTPPTHDVLVMADQEALGQVVLNLLINAVEAVQLNDVDDRREITLSLRTIDDATAEFSVCDNGPGPNGTVQSTIFEPFVTSKAEGVGLGLAVAKEIVEAHHGSISWVRTDKNTSFRVVIPTIEKGAARV